MTPSVPCASCGAIGCATTHLDYVILVVNGEDALAQIRDHDEPVIDAMSRVVRHGRPGEQWQLSDIFGEILGRPDRVTMGQLRSRSGQRIYCNLYLPKWDGCGTLDAATSKGDGNAG